MIISIRTYALALFEIALEQDRTLEYYEELKDFSIILKNEEISYALNQSLADYRIFDGFWKSAQLEFSREMINFLKILQEAAILKHLDRVIAAYREELQKAGFLYYVEVRSTNKLSRQEQEEIKDLIESHYSGVMEYKFEQDTSLIAGYQVKINQDIYDISIKNKLNQILKQGGFVHE